MVTGCGALIEERLREGPPREDLKRPSSVRAYVHAMWPVTSAPHPRQTTPRSGPPKVRPVPPREPDGSIGMSFYLIAVPIGLVIVIPLAGLLGLLAWSGLFWIAIPEIVGCALWWLVQRSKRRQRAGRLPY